jgi:hypothetical protein
MTKAIDFTQVPALPPISKPATHTELRKLADAAYAQFIALGGKVTVLPPGPKN